LSNETTRIYKFKQKSAELNNQESVNLLPIHL